MNVSVYSEPIVNVERIINQFFGTAADSAVYDIAILFSFLILFIFIFCILGCLFRSGPKR